MFSSPLKPLSSPTQQCSSFCEIIYNTNNKSKIQIVRLYCSVTSKRQLAASAWRFKKNTQITRLVCKYGGQPKPGWYRDGGKPQKNGLILRENALSEALGAFF